MIANKANCAPIVQTITIAVLVCYSSWTSRALAGSAVARAVLVGRVPVGRLAVRNPSGLLPCLLRDTTIRCATSLRVSLTHMQLHRATHSSHLMLSYSAAPSTRTRTLEPIVLMCFVRRVRRVLRIEFETLKSRSYIIGVDHSCILTTQLIPIYCITIV